MTTETPVADIVTQNVTQFETALSQTVPLQPRAYVRVAAVQEATLLHGIQKRITAAKKAVFATTASDDGLEVLAREFDVERIDAVYYQATCTVDADTGSSVPAGSELTSDSTGAYYTVDSTASESGSSITFAVTASSAGSDANLEDGETLTFTSPISGVDTTATISVVDEYGDDQEDRESWRARILRAERYSTGGGNTADYRLWGEEVENVAAIYPYSGRPVSWKIGPNSTISFDAEMGAIEIVDGSFTDGDLGTLVKNDVIVVSGSSKNDGAYTVSSVHTTKIAVVEALPETESSGLEITIRNSPLPGDRTIYVESDDEEADGIPTEALLDLVRVAVSADSAGVGRPSLGDVDSTLYVEPITRTEIDIVIYSLVCDESQKTEIKAKVEEDLATYLKNVSPFILALDYEMDRTDTITFLAVSEVVQNIFATYGASADLVEIQVGGSVVTSYQMGQGEKAKLGTLSWLPEE